LRAGLIIGGLFLMFVGIFLFLTIILIPFAALCGFIGFIMLIVGLVTSPHPKQVIYNYPPQAQAPTIVYPQSQSTQKVLAICPKCNSRIDADNSFCPKCGADIRPKNPTV